MSTRAKPPALLKLLRPAKVRSALGRRRFEWQLERTPVSGRGEPVALGSDYGGWMVPAALIKPGWTCYCAGAGADISFDLALLERFDVRVQSVEPVDAVRSGRARGGCRRAPLRGTPRGDRHRRRAAAGAAHPQPRRPGATPARNCSTPTSSWRFRGARWQASRAELGHPRVDLLKLDLEGGEYEVIPQLDLTALQVKVLAFQLHHNRGPRAARRVIEHLEKRGFEAVAIKPAVKLTFARRDLLGT